MQVSRRSWHWRAQGADILALAVTGRPPLDCSVTRRPRQGAWAGPAREAGLRQGVCAALKGSQTGSQPCAG